MKLGSSNGNLGFLYKLGHLGLTHHNLQIRDPLNLISLAAYHSSSGYLAHGDDQFWEF